MDALLFCHCRDWQILVKEPKKVNKRLKGERRQKKVFFFFDKGRTKKIVQKRKKGTKSVQ